MIEKISVKKKHIQDGIRDSIYCCPIAEALREIGKIDINVGVLSIFADNKVYSVSKKVKSFIGKFDKGEKVKPFKFLLKEKLA